MVFTPLWHPEDWEHPERRPSHLCVLSVWSMLNWNRVFPGAISQVLNFSVCPEVLLIPNLPAPDRTSMSSPVHQWTVLISCVSYTSVDGLPLFLSMSWLLHDSGVCHLTLKPEHSSQVFPWANPPVYWSSSHVFSLEVTDWAHPGDILDTKDWEVLFFFFFFGQHLDVGIFGRQVMWCGCLPKACVWKACATIGKVVECLRDGA
jgi:hypothetical protein